MHILVYICSKVRQFEISAHDVVPDLACTAHGVATFDMFGHVLSAKTAGLHISTPLGISPVWS